MSRQGMLLSMGLRRNRHVVVGVQVGQLPQGFLLAFGSGLLLLRSPHRNNIDPYSQNPGHTYDQEKRTNKLAFLSIPDILFKMIYFIRHAESRYNLAEKEIQHQIGANYSDSETYLNAKFDRKYLDVEITENGITQSQKARDLMKDIEVDVVLVSPLRRALHTCSIIFSGHKSKAQVIVQPAFREIMESSNDIGTEIRESITKYSLFNFDNIKDLEAWFVSTLNPQDREIVEKKLEGLEGQARKEKAIEEALRIQKENWFERRQHPEKESQLKVRILPDAAQQKKVIQHYLQTYKRIAIVAHSQCIKHYAGYKIANCQIFEYPAQKL